VSGEEFPLMRVLAPFLALSLAATMTFALTAAAQDAAHDTMNSPGDSPEISAAPPDGQWGHGHAENHDWYQKLKQPGTGYSCCNGDVTHGDCRPTRAYLTEEGTWRAMIDGHWTPVPPSVVLKQLAPDGNSHVCAGKSGMIYCFIGGSPKS
jgi:hypothetical protein